MKPDPASLAVARQRHIAGTALSTRRCPPRRTALLPLRRLISRRVLVVGQAHLRQILSFYAAYYNEVRTHLVLGKYAPLGRTVQRTGIVVAIPILSGLHHHYVRI